MTEEELAFKCKQADNQARKELYEQYGGSLLAICLRYIGDRETACDVMAFYASISLSDSLSTRGKAL